MSAPEPHREWWGPGERAWFEYHCLESHDSADAAIWYRSHEQVTVVGTTDCDAPDGSTLAERARDGVPRCHTVRHDDGFTHTVFEDELYTGPEHWERPDPPAPRAAA